MQGAAKQETGIFVCFSQLQNSHLLMMKVMAAEDYKADVSLTSACGQELAELQCAKEQEGEHEAVHLSTVLLCLEAGMREEKVKVATSPQLSSKRQNRQADNPIRTHRLEADVCLRCRRSDVH